MPRLSAWAESDQPVFSSAPQPGQDLALGGTNAPQLGQTSGGICELRFTRLLFTETLVAVNHEYKSSGGAGVFLVGLEFQSHQDVVMRDGLHVPDVIVEA